MISRDELQQARKVPLPSLLPADHTLIKKGANKYMALCVFHDETTPSMSLQQYPDGSWGYRCFGCGATGDPVTYLQKTTDMDFMDSVRFLIKSAKEAPPKPKLVQTYDYQDESGKTLYQVLRYEPKNFRCRQATEQGWSWCLNGVRRVLYHLPELIQREHDTIYYVEGEKDVETLRSKGLLATTHQGGANSFRNELLGPLAVRRRMVVVPDRDEPGMALMRRVFAAGRKLGHDVGFLILPRHKDVSDWFGAGETLEDLMKEVR